MYVTIFFCDRTNVRSKLLLLGHLPNLVGHCPMSDSNLQPCIIVFCPVLSNRVVWYSDLACSIMPYLSCHIYHAIFIMPYLSCHIYHAIFIMPYLSCHIYHAIFIMPYLSCHIYHAIFIMPCSVCNVLPYSLFNVHCNYEQKYTCFSNERI